MLSKSYYVVEYSVLDITHVDYINLSIRYNVYHTTL